MQRIDAVIAGALVVAAAGSLIGVLTYEDDRLGEFVVTWSTSTVDLEAESVSHAGPGEAEATVEVAERNITRITFTVAITGGPARVQPTALRVEIVSPTNETTSVEGEIPAGPTTTVELPVEVVLAGAPEAATVTGPTIDAAREALNATLSSTLGIGTWTIRASFAPTTPALGGQESHSLAVVATVESYRGELALVAPEVGR